MRTLQAQFYEHYSSLLATRQVAHRDLVGMTFQTILAEAISDGLIVLILKSIPQMLHRCFGHRQSVDKVLVVNSHSEKSAGLVHLQILSHPKNQLRPWAYRKRGLRFTSPFVGSNSPVRSFSNVVLPAPT